MATRGGVWGIDVGQCALKAIKLRAADDGKVEVVAFDLIEHPKILSQPDADPDELIKAALEKFASRNDWQKDEFVIGVPGQQTFARFSKLPPVDEKKIPDLVKYEAAQQIPFDMNDVVWSYQVFQAPDSPEVEVGIFAMRKDLIRKHLDYFANLGVAPIAIQTIPCALYNFCGFDAKSAEKGATVVIDVGAQNTDLIVVDESTAWTRNIPLGGNAFTESLVKQFKCSFSQAEKLKRIAGDHKEARRIFQTMRPVFTDLTAEIQRSLGFYSSTHREVELTHVLACGNAFLLPGLVKYLETNLTIGADVTRLEKFQKIIPNETVNAPNFTDNILSFGAAYGLALQGLGLGAVSANLLPPELARIAMWKRKSWWFMASAACLGIATILPWARNTADASQVSLDNEDMAKAKAIVKQAQDYKTEFSAAQSNTGDKKAKIEKLFDVLKDRAVIPQIIQMVHDALPEVDVALVNANSKEALEKLVKAAPDRYARTKRRQMFIENLRIQYAPNIDELDPPPLPAVDNSFVSGGGGGGGFRGGGDVVSETGHGGGGRFHAGGGESQPPPTDPAAGGTAGAAASPGFYVSFNVRLLYGASAGDAVEFIDKVYYPGLRKLANEGDSRGNKYPFYIPEEDPKAPDQKNLERPNPTRSQQVVVNRPSRSADPAQPGEAPAAPQVMDPDPVTGEERATDWKFPIGFKVKMGQWVPKPAAPADGQPAPTNP